MSHSKFTIAVIKQRLSALGSLESRTQFGGYSLAVDKTVFAVVAEGQLYLRACETVQPCRIDRNVQPLRLIKGGLPVALNYYRVQEALWSDEQRLVALAALCLQGARLEKQRRLHQRRIKDLPNMGIRMESLLRQVGICTITVLKQQGSRRSWLRLRQQNKHLGLPVLLALEGAITGLHSEALSLAVKEELRLWFNHNTQPKTEERRGRQVCQ